MDTYCDVAGSDGLFGWVTFGACYAYTFSQNQDVLADNEAGVNCKNSSFLLCFGYDDANQMF